MASRVVIEPIPSNSIDLLRRGYIDDRQVSSPVTDYRVGKKNSPVVVSVAWCGARKIMGKTRDPHRYSRNEFVNEGGGAGDGDTNG